MKRRFWSTAELRILRRRYPIEPTSEIARDLQRRMSGVYAKAAQLGLKKSAQYLASPAACRLRRGGDDHPGRATQFPKGHVPANKGLRRPGYAPGRMAETQFKPGNHPARWDPDFYVLGALRVNADGYIDMRVSFEPGARGWRALHRILWEDVHGPVPASHALVFKNGDRLDVELANLEVIPRAELMRRNTIHNLPAPLRSTINVLGQLKRRIREKQDRGPAQSPVLDAGGPARQRQADGDRAREGDRRRRPGDRERSEGGERLHSPDRLEGQRVYPARGGRTASGTGHAQADQGTRAKRVGLNAAAIPHSYGARPR